jgi:hypothetical protein
MHCVYCVCVVSIHIWVALCVRCFLLFPLCIVEFPCLCQCKVYCHRVNNQLQYNNNNDYDKDKPFKSPLKGKGLLPPVGLARLD